jgi:hypothetical protein
MSRMSPEPKAAANFRVGGQYQSAPRWLSKEKADIWHEIIKSKPKDFFYTVQPHILAQLCSALAEAKSTSIILHWTDFPTIGDRIEVVRVLAVLNVNCATLSTKLRLTAQQNVESDVAFRHRDQARTKPSLAIG